MGRFDRAIPEKGPGMITFITVKDVARESNFLPRAIQS
jgi:hypothetical protein